MLAAIHAHQSEDLVRAKFHDYVQSIADIAFDDAEFPNEATRRKVRCGAKRARADSPSGISLLRGGRMLLVGAPPLSPPFDS